jgi:hypothetical protein
VLVTGLIAVPPYGTPFPLAWNGQGEFLLDGSSVSSVQIDGPFQTTERPPAAFRPACGRRRVCYCDYIYIDVWLWLEVGTMGDRLYRTQVLLEPAQHRALAAIARVEGRSLSDVLREMIREQLARRREAREAELRRDLAVLERIREHREEILREHGGRPLDVDPVELVNEGRDERDAAILGRAFAARN